MQGSVGLRDDAGGCLGVDSTGGVLGMSGWPSVPTTTTMSSIPKAALVLPPAPAGCGGAGQEGKLQALPGLASRSAGAGKGGSAAGNRNAELS